MTGKDAWDQRLGMVAPDNLVLSVGRTNECRAAMMMMDGSDIMNELRD